MTRGRPARARRVAARVIAATAALAATVLALTACAPPVDPGWRPAERPALDFSLEGPTAGYLDQATVPGLVPQRIRSDAAGVAARWTYLPGETEFNDRLDELVTAAIAAHRKSSGRSAYSPAASDPGAGLGDRGCVPGSTARPAGDLLADPAFSPRTGNGDALVIVCDVAVASGPFLAERVRTVQGSPDAVVGDTTTVLYTDTSTGAVTTGAELVDRAGLPALWTGVVTALRREAGALWDVEIAQPAPDALEAFGRALESALIGPGGTIAIELPASFSPPELASLAGAAERRTGVVLPPELARAALTPFGDAVVDSLAAGAPYAGPADLPASSDRIDCDLVPCVAVTFDDGPAEYTPQVLDALAASGSSATFFVIGTKAQAAPEIVARAHDEGNQIANHTWTHPELTTVPDEKIAEEVGKTSDVIARITGERPQYFRPPFGAVDDRVMAALGKARVPAILWDIDTNDWRHPSDEVLVERGAEQAEVGSIILLHDVHEQTARNVPAIIDGLRDRGFTLVTLDRLFDSATPAPGTKVKARG